MGPHPKQLFKQTGKIGIYDIEKRLALYGFEMVDERYDQNGSNCLFSAFLNQLKQHKVLSEKTKITPETLREKAVKWIANNLDYVVVNYGGLTVEDMIIDVRPPAKTTPKKYINAMSNPNEWGDEITLYALVAVYNVEVGLISSMKNSCELILPPSNNAVARIFIGSIKGRHFVSTRPINYD